MSALFQASVARRAIQMLMLLLIVLPSVGAIQYANVPPPSIVSSQQFPDYTSDVATAWDGQSAYLFGGWGYNPVSQQYEELDTIYRYDPSEDELVLMDTHLPVGLDYPSAYWWGDYAYVFGGWGPSGVSDEILRYDPATDSLEVLDEHLPIPLAYSTLVGTGGSAYLFGGYGDAGGLDTIMRFDAATESITLLSEVVPCSDGYDSAMGFWTGEAIYLFGGYCEDAIQGSSQYRIFAFDPDTESISEYYYELPSRRTAAFAFWDQDTETGYILGGNGNSYPIPADESVIQFKVGHEPQVLDETLPLSFSWNGGVWTGQNAYLFGAGGNSNEIFQFNPKFIPPPTHELVTARDRHSSVAFNGKIYTLGGWDTYGTRLDTIEEYDPQLGVSTQKQAHLPEKRWVFSSVATDEAIYVMGGMKENGFGSQTIYRYDPVADTIQTLAATLPYDISGNVAVWDGDHYIYSMGGDSWDGGGTMDDIVRFDTETLEVVTLPQVLSEALQEGSGAWAEGSAYVFGGVRYPGGLQPDIIKFTPATGTVTRLATALPGARVNTAAAYNGDYIYIAGGYGTGPADTGELSEVLRFNPETDDLTLMPTPLPYHGLEAPGAAASNGIVYVTGGLTDDASPGESALVIPYTSFTPNPVDDLVALQVGPDEVEVSWLPGPAAGSPNIGYRVYRSLSPSGPWDTLGTVGATPLFLDDTIQAGETYYYTVRAINDQGRGQISQAVGVTQLAKPEAPRNVQGIPGPNPGGIALTWQVPLNDAGSRIQGYKVYRATSASGPYQLAGQSDGPALVFYDTGLASGTYHYKVRAFNFISDGDDSSPIATATETVPGQPRALTASVSGTDVQLDWLQPLGDGGSPITSYALEASTDGGATFDAVATIPAPASQTLTPPCDPACIYRIAATNVAGTGAASNHASTLPGYADLEPESIRGNTPGAGTGLQSVFPCEEDSGSVNLATGQFVSSTCLLAIDSPLGLDISVVATQRSHSTLASPVGPGWDLSILRRLDVQGNGDAVLADGGGRRDRFEWDGTEFQSPTGFYAVLEADGPGYRMRLPGGISEAFDATGRRTLVEDSVGNQVTFTYDLQGRPLEIREPAGGSVSFQYEGDQLRRINDFAARTIELRHDSDGTLAEVLVPGDDVGSSFTYTRDGDLASAMDADRRVYLVNEYDALGRVDRQSDGVAWTDFGYGPGSASVTDQNGNVVDWAYTTAPLPAATQRTEHTNRDVVASEPDQYVTLYEVNSQGETSRITDPDGRSTILVYDDLAADPRARGNLLSETRRSSASEADLVTTFTYEPTYQLLRSKTAPAGNDPAYVPSNGGANSPERHTTVFWYGQDEASQGDLNGDGNVGWPPALGVRVEFPTVNPEGAPHPLLSSGDQARVSTVQYNQRGQIERSTNPDGSSVTYDYFEPGETSTPQLYRLQRVERFSGPAGPSMGMQTMSLAAGLEPETLEVALSSGDPSMTMMVASTGNGVAEEYAYDDAGNQVLRIDGNGALQSWTYDSRDRVVRQGFDDPAIFVNYTYDGAGNVVKVQRSNAAQQEDGSYLVDSEHPVVTDRYQYNARGQMTLKEEDTFAPAGSGVDQANSSFERYTYDGAGNLVLREGNGAVTGTDPHDVTTYLYNERNQLVASTLGGRTPQFTQHTDADVGGIEQNLALYLHASVSQVDSCPSNESLNQSSACVSGPETDCPGGANGTLADQSVCLPPSRYPQANEGLEQVGTLPTARQGVSMVWDAGRGKAYVMGGVRGSTFIDEIVAYDPETRTSTIVGHMPTGRWLGSAAFDGRYAYFVGGCLDGCTTATDDIVRFDAATGAVEVVADLPYPLRGSTAVWDGDRVLIFGGCGSPCSATKKVIAFDPESATVTILATELPRAHLNMASVWTGDEVLLFGGTGTGGNEIVHFQPSTGTSTVAAAKLPYSVSEMGASWDGEHAFVFGGFKSTGQYYASILRYTPAEGEVVTMTQPLPAKAFRTATVWAVDSALVALGFTTTYSNKLLAYQPTIAAPLEPFDLLVTPGPTPGDNTIQWQAPNATGSTSLLRYNIHRATSLDGPWTAIGTSPAGERHFVDSQPGDVGAKSYYAVSAVNGDLEGPKSAPAYIVNAPRSPVALPIGLCPGNAAGAVVAGNPACLPTGSCPDGSTGAIIPANAASATPTAACARVFGCPEGNVGTVVNDQPQCQDVSPVCGDLCPYEGQVICYLPSCTYVVPGFLAAHVGPDGIGAQVGIPIAPGTPALPPIEDADAFPLAVELQAGSNPWNPSSTPLTDDDGDGKLNQLEATPPILCTGSLGVVGGPGCNGYKNPSGYTWPQPIVRDSSERLWVWDGICLPGLVGDYATCKATSNRNLSTTSYAGTMTADGYGWRRITTGAADKFAEYYAPSTDPLTDGDGDGIPTIEICRNPIRIDSSGYVASLGSYPWMQIGDTDGNTTGGAVVLEPIVIYVPLGGLPYNPQQPTVDTDPDEPTVPEEPEPEPSWMWTFTMNETRGTSLKAAPASSIAPARVSWEWQPDGGFDLAGRAQLAFWAVRHGDSTPSGTWNARLYVDDELVASTPIGGRSFEVPVSGTPQEYRVDFGQLGLDGAALRLEVDLDSDPGGRWLLYDGEGYDSRLEIGPAVTTTTTYDASGRPLVTTDQNGAQTFNDYDGHGRSRSVTTPDGSTTTNTYDTNGRLIGSETHGPIDLDGTVGLLERNRAFYDEAGRMYRLDRQAFDTATGTSLADGPLTPGDGYITTLFDYDANDRLTGVVDDNEGRHTFTYDGLGNLVASDDPLGNRVEFGYDAAGNLAEQTAIDVDPAGVPVDPRTTRFAYDGLNQLASVTDPLGRVHRFGYDSRGNLAWQSDGRSDTYVQDDLFGGQVNADGNLVRYTYDADDRLVATTHEVRQGGVGSGAVTDNITTTQEWDGSGRLVRQTDDDGAATSYSYDVLGRLAQVTNADGTATTYAYDAVGHVVRTEDPNGNAILQTYDAAGRLVARESTSSWSASQEFAYDGLGRLLRATDSNNGGSTASTIDLGYDSLGRAVSDSQGTHTVGRQFDGLGNKVGLTYSNGRTLEATYDAANRVTELADALGTLATFAYLGDKLAEQESGNGVTSTYDYDAAQQLTSLRHDVANSPRPVQVDYAYDGNGNRIQEELHHAPEWSLQATYDSLGRMTAIERSNFEDLAAALQPLEGILPTSHEWALTGTNEWATQDTVEDGVQAVREFGHDQMHAVTSIDAGGDETGRTYDDNGNLMDDGDRTYEWDAFNRLRRIRDAGGELIEEYHYDALGRRTQVVTGTQTTTFVYDGHNVIEEYVDGELDVQYVHGVGQDRPLLMDRDLDGDGVATGAADQRLYYLQDAHGSVIGLADTTGTVVEGYLYDAYGRAAVVHANGAGIQWDATDLIATASAFGNPYMFTGQRFDRNTGQYYYRARYYAPDLGSFLSRDPIGVWGDRANLGNPYSYVANNPLGAADPFGTWGICWSCAWRTVTQAVQVVYTAVQYVVETVVEAVQDFTQEAVDWAGDVVDSVVDFASDAAEAVGDTAGNIGADILEGIEITARAIFGDACVDGGDSDGCYEYLCNSAGSRYDPFTSLGCHASDAYAASQEGTYCNGSLLYQLGCGVKEGLLFALDIVPVPELKLGGVFVAAGIKHGDDIAKAGVRAGKRFVTGSADNLALDMAKQGKHIPGHPNYIPGRSTLTADPNSLKSFIGKGQQVGEIPIGQAGSRERIDFGRPIGEWVDPSTGQGFSTTKGIVHYAKDGYHIVPARP